MLSKIIAVSNQKGGVGKSNISLHLAASLGLRRYKTLLIDADIQGTVTRVVSNAPDAKPFPAAVVGLSHAQESIHREIRKFVADYDFIVIDCPPSAESKITQSALLIADLVLVPMIPSPEDAWAAVGIKRLIEHASVVNEALQARIVPSMCDTRARLAREMLEYLDTFGIPLSSSRIGHRTAYKECKLTGQTVHAFGKAAAIAIKEVEDLTDEILHILKV